MLVPFPRTVGSWITYGVCGLVFVVGVIDQAFGGPMLFVLLGVLVLGLTFLAQLVNLPSRWRDAWWRRFLPPLLCLLVLPGVWLVGPRLLIARFYWYRAQYEALANSVRVGGHPSESLEGSERSLGRWVKATHINELQEDSRPARRVYSTPSDPPPRSDYLEVVGVHFLVLTHGYAGHAGFMHTFNSEAEHQLDKGPGADGWSFSGKITDGWYLVAD